MSYGNKPFLVKCYNCPEMITFDKSIVSESGKKIPLWPDKKNTHSHDKDGNPIRDKLPESYQQSQQQQGQQYYQPERTQQPSQQGQSTLTTNYDDIKKELVRQDLKIDGLFSKTAHIEEMIQALLAKESFVSASNLPRDTQQETAATVDPVMVNHSQIADDNMNKTTEQQQND